MAYKVLFTEYLMFCVTESTYEFKVKFDIYITVTASNQKIVISEV